MGNARPSEQEPAAAPPMPTIEDVRRWPVTVDIVTAGSALGIGRTCAYYLARRGEFPARVVKIGRLSRVISADLLAFLESQHGDDVPAVAESDRAAR